MAKKKLNKAERQEARLRKARQWAMTYSGSHIVRAYRKRFGLDPTCAMKDMAAIGALDPDNLAAMQQAEQVRLEQRQREREAKNLQEYFDRFPDSNDQFFFIAGYTSGGAPYGVTWDEMGFSPWESPDE